MDEPSIRWTVRLSLLLLYLVLIRQARGRGYLPQDRVCWTLGAALMLIHILLAFHFAHDWSHAAAAAETARQTREVVGVGFGGGVWGNYIFMISWGVDAAWWWFREAVYRQRRAWLRLGLAGFWVFIAFNATVVFEDGITRWVGGILSLTWLLCVCLEGRKKA